MPPVNVDHWLDLVGLLIIGTALVAVPTVPAWISARRSGGANKQLQNGSEGSENLFRHAFDAFVEDMHGRMDDFRDRFDDFHDRQKDLGEELGAVRKEVGDQRQDSLAFERRVVRAYRRDHPDSDPL